MFVDPKREGEVTQAPAKVMKLSEAIRIGARKRPQCSSRFFKEGGSCVLGAALEAHGYGPDERGWDPEWMVYETICPILGISLDLAQRVAILNDQHGMTREAIADRVEREGY